METINFDIRIFLYITEKTSENIGRTAHDIAEMIISGNKISINLTEIDDVEHMFAVVEGVEKVRYAVYIIKNIRNLDSKLFGRIELKYKHKIITIDTY